MANVDKLIKLADSYYLSAKTAQNAQLSSYFVAVTKRMAELATWGLASAKHLASKPEFANSEGLKVILDNLPKILNACQTADPKSAQYFMDNIAGLIGQTTFYTSSGNAGTGYDRMTSTKSDGYTPPSWYINSIDTSFRALKSQYEKLKTPTNVS